MSSFFHFLECNLLDFINILRLLFQTYESRMGSHVMTENCL